MKFAAIEDLKYFLVAAKQSSYAAQGDEASVVPLLAGSKQLEIDAGAFAYRDIYFGMTRFAGQETVTHERRVVWSMAYAGGLDPDVAPTKATAVYAALRTALLKPMPDIPVRGPARVTVETFEYACGVNGDLTAFSGHEVIVEAGRQVYSMSFTGGLIQ